MILFQSMHNKTSFSKSSRLRNSTYIVFTDNDVSVSLTILINLKT